MTTGSMIVGSGEAGEIVNTPVVALRPGSVAGIWKLIVSVPGVALACWIAARRVQWPVPSSHAPSAALLSGPSPVELIVKVEAAAAFGAKRPERRSGPNRQTESASTKARADTRLKS